MRAQVATLGSAPTAHLLVSFLPNAVPAPTTQFSGISMQTVAPAVASGLEVVMATATTSRPKRRARMHASPSVTATSTTSTSTQTSMTSVTSLLRVVMMSQMTWMPTWKVRIVLEMVSVDVAVDVWMFS